MKRWMLITLATAMLTGSTVYAGWALDNLEKYYIDVRQIEDIQTTDKGCLAMIVMKNGDVYSLEE